MDEQLPAGLGPRVIYAREVLGLSQAELADLAGIGRPALNRIESGERNNPGRDILRRLARALRVSTDFLCEMDRNDLLASPHA